MIRFHHIPVFRSLQRMLVRYPGRLATAPLSRVFGLDRGRPIDRHYIEQFLDGHRDAIRGRVLEVADTTYTHRYGRDITEAVALHVAGNGRPDTLTGDLGCPESLPAARFDCFVCTQTFNFIYDVHAAIAGAAHVLRPGGTLLATVAGISQISRYDMDRWGDYWRFTSASCARLFSEHFAQVDIRAYGNVLAATAFLQGMAVEDLADPTWLDVPDYDYQLLIGIRARTAA